MKNSTRFHPNKTQNVLLKLINGYFSKTKKRWNLIDQEWMLEKMKEWYDLTITRSCLSVNLRKLREVGLLNSVSRHWMDPKTGKFEPRVTLYKMTKKMKQFFGREANYFRRCGWVPDIKGLRDNRAPVVGTCTTPERMHEERQHLKLLAQIELESRRLRC